MQNVARDHWKTNKILRKSSYCVDLEFLVLFYFYKIDETLISCAVPSQNQTWYSEFLGFGPNKQFQTFYSRFAPHPDKKRKHGKVILRHSDNLNLCLVINNEM